MFPPPPFFFPKEVEQSAAELGAGFSLANNNYSAALVMSHNTILNQWSADGGFQQFPLTQHCALPPPQPAELTFHDGDTTWHRRCVHLHLFQSRFGKHDTNIFTRVCWGGGSQFDKVIRWALVGAFSQFKHRKWFSSIFILYCKKSDGFLMIKTSDCQCEFVLPLVDVPAWGK